MNDTESFVRAMFAGLFAEPEKYFGPRSEFYMRGPGLHPLVGPEQMKQGFTALAARLTDVSIDFLSFAAAGNLVFSERIDHFTVDGKHPIDLPIVGMGKIGADGKFLYWKDFFDLTPLARVNLEPDGAGVATFQL